MDEPMARPPRDEEHHPGRMSYSEALRVVNEEWARWFGQGLIRLKPDPQLRWTCHEEESPDKSMDEEGEE